jgi:hypothetical protein
MTPAVQTRLSRYAAMVIALLAWYGLLLQLYVVIMTARSTGASVATAVVNYFSFFTILTNLLLAMVLTLSLQPEASALHRFCARPTVQSAIAVFIAIVGIVYSIALRHVWDPEGLQKIADVVLHDATPVLYVVYWLLFVRKDELRFRDVPAWLLYPGVYAVYSMIRGALTGRYPYHFLDAGVLGYPHTVVNIVVLLAAFLGVSLLVVAIGRWMPRKAAL